MSHRCRESNLAAHIAGSRVGTGRAATAPGHSVAVLSCPRRGRTRNARESNVRAAASKTREHSRRLVAESAVIGRLFEALIADFYQRAAGPATGTAHTLRLAELLGAAAHFGRQARAQREAPETMLIVLKATLRDSAPTLRALGREQLAHDVTRRAIEGYYDIGQTG